MGKVGLTVAIPHDIDRLQANALRGLLKIERIVVIAEVQAVLLTEVLIEPEVILECVVKRAHREIPLVERG